MSDLLSATAAPRTIAIEDVEYRVAPLTDAQWAMVIAQVQDNYLAIATRFIDKLPDPLRVAALRAAYDGAAALTLRHEIAKAQLQTADVAAFVFWLALQKHNPSVTRAQVRTWMADRELQKRFGSVFELAQGIAAATPAEDGAPGKTTATA